MDLLNWIFVPEAWFALVTLAALEIVLGIDNIIFISIMVARVEPDKRHSTRLLGLAFAMITRIMLLMSLAWIMRLQNDLFTLFSKGISGKDLILIGGGLFLLLKSTHEIHQNLEGDDQLEESKANATKAGIAAIILQIAIIDIIFSLDSVITAVGMANHLPVMILAIIIAVGVMMFAAKSIGDFVDRHPTIKILALSFLIVIGVTLMAEGFGYHIPKGYIYFAMAFSVSVEMINLRIRAKTAPVKLHRAMPESQDQ